MAHHSLPDDLVTELRAACNSGKGNYGHRLLCGKAADCIDQLRMPHAAVLKLAERQDGADGIALVNALYRKIEAQKREIARVQQRLKDAEEDKRDAVTERSWQERQGDEYGSY